MKKEQDLKCIAKHIRKLIVNTVYNAKAGHLGGPLSAVDIMTALYFEHMNINPKFPNDLLRDRFVLSKGHAAVGLYCTLAARGYFDEEKLDTFDKINSRLQAHPDMKLLQGLDFSSGSLGQGISGAAGIALAGKLKEKDYYTYCLLGDGESQEGQVWEAFDFIAKYNLRNLITIIDCNGFQQYGFRNNGVIQTPQKNIYDKIESFGLRTTVIDGHSFNEIRYAIDEAKLKKLPTVIIANTIKGKGVSFMENQPSWHSRVPSKEEFDKAMEELV